MVAPTDLVFHLTGGQFGSTNQDPAASLGGQMAGALTSDVFNNLWEDVTDAQRLAGITAYRWIVLENKSSDTLLQPRFYFLPKDPYVDIEFSRLALGAAVGVLQLEDDRPPEAEIGPEEDVPMPFTKSTEDYDSTQSVAPDIPAGAKLYICIRREIPAESLADTRAYVLIVETSPGQT